MDGSSKVDGECVLGWEFSSARTTSAGVPLVACCAKIASEAAISRYRISPYGIRCGGERWLLLIMWFWACPMTRMLSDGELSQEI